MSASCFLPEGLYGVIGWPLAQSLSPLVHNTGFQTLGIPATYLRWEIMPENLADFINSVRLLDIRGCSVTIPHKVALLDLVDQVSSLARKAGAANTIYWDGGRLCAENTDVSGFLAPLASLDLADTTVLVLGAGGAARAVVTGLTDRKCGKIFVATPSDKSHLPLCDQFGAEPLPWNDRHQHKADIVVNTTPLGMTGKAENQSPYDFYKAGMNAGIAYDIVYNPLKTKFLADANELGIKCISGLEMFFSQADAQFRLWTDNSLPAESRTALCQKLGA